MVYTVLKELQEAKKIPFDNVCASHSFVSAITEFEAAIALLYSRSSSTPRETGGNKFIRANPTMRFTAELRFPSR